MERSTFTRKNPGRDASEFQTPPPIGLPNSLRIHLRGTDVIRPRGTEEVFQKGSVVRRWPHEFERLPRRGAYATKGTHGQDHPQVCELR